MCTYPTKKYVMFRREKIWHFTLDGSSTHQGEGQELCYMSLMALVVSLSFRLEFPCSNNVAEYEALAIWAHICLVNGNSEASVEGRF